MTDAFDLWAKQNGCCTSSAQRAWDEITLRKNTEIDALREELNTAQMDARDANTAARESALECEQARLVLRRAHSCTGGAIGGLCGDCRAKIERLLALPKVGFAHKIAEIERERCAKICEMFNSEPVSHAHVAVEIRSAKP